jgi:hypothetical protein
MNQPLDQLYELLPAIYRQRDRAEGEPLRALLAAVENELGVIETDISDLYENWFIETCAEWVVPYIGDLLSSQELYGTTTQAYGQQQRRAYVANTLAYRRRKGTATVLEQLVRDVTDWRSRAVEFYQLLATTQNLDHVRPSVTTVDLRSAQASEPMEGLLKPMGLRRSNRSPDQIGTPFERNVAYTAEVREMGTFQRPADRGRYHNRHIGLFIWRLQSYPLERVLARRVNGPEPEPTGRYYTFNPLGYDQAPLFNQPQTETDILHLAEEFNVPTSLRRPLLAQELSDRRQAQLQGLPIEGAHYLGTNPVLQIFIDGLPHPIPPEDLQICSLKDANQPPGQDWISLPPQPADNPTQNQPHCPPDDPPTRSARAAIDPETGRFAFFGPQLPQKVEVSYLYGFSGDLGGGPYNREGVVDSVLAQTLSSPSQVFAHPIDPLRWQVKQKESAAANPLAIAIKTWNRTVLAWQALHEHTAIPLHKIILPPNRVSRVTGDPKLPNRPVFKPGIVEGLSVALSACKTRITVFSGAAVDDQGQRIGLTRLVEIDLQTAIEQSQTSPEPLRLLVVASFLALEKSQLTPINLVPETALAGYPLGRLIALERLEILDGKVELAPDRAALRPAFQSGIVAGLAVLTPQGRMEVLVTAGQAVDQQGYPITIAHNTTVDLCSHQGQRGPLVLIPDCLPDHPPAITFIPATTAEQNNSPQAAFHLAYLDIPHISATLIPIARILKGLEVQPLPEPLAIKVTSGTAQDSWGKAFNFSGQDRIDLKDFRDQEVQLVLFTGADRRHSQGSVAVIRPGTVSRWVRSSNDEKTEERDVETYIVLANLYLTPKFLDQAVEPATDGSPPWLRPAGRLLEGLTVSPESLQSRITIQPGQAIDGTQNRIELEQACQFDLSNYAGRTLIVFISSQAEQGLPDFAPVPDRSASPGYQFIGVVPEEPVSADDGLIVVEDNATYEGNLTVILPADRKLTIMAANGLRPHVQGDFVVQGSPTLQAALFNGLTLDGLLVTGSLQIRPGQLQHLQVRHCTILAPGGGLVVEETLPTDKETDNEDCANALQLIFYCLLLIQRLLRIGIGLESSSPQQNLAQLKHIAFQGFQQILGGLQQAIERQWLLTATADADERQEGELTDITGDNDRLEITLIRTICGAITLANSVAKLQIEASVVDAYSAQPKATSPLLAIRAPGTEVTLQASTVLGQVAVRRLGASDSLFTEKVTVARQQVGCLRFSHVPEGSRTPTRYRCQPQQTLVETLSRLPEPITAIALTYPAGSGQAHPRMFVSTAGGGVFRSSVDMTLPDWQPPNQQPANTTITALFAESDASGNVTLWAGAADGSLFRTDNWNSDPTSREKTLWRSVGLDSIHTKIMQLAAVDQVMVIATAGNGILLSQAGSHWQVLTTQEPGIGTLTSSGTTVRGQGTAFNQLQSGDVINAAGQSRTLVRVDASDRLTVDQPFRPDLPAGTLFTVNTGLTNPNITCLAIHNDQLWVGSEGGGVFQLVPKLTDAVQPGQRSRWIDISWGLTDRDVTALVVDPNGQLFVGTQNDGVFRLLPGRDRWEPMGLPETTITALAIFPRPMPSGTISSQNNLVTGTNTSFTTDLQVGDVITAMDQSRRVETGVADVEYVFYFLAIAKLLHDQYFRLLDFYFHTLIQQRPISQTEQQLQVDLPFCPDLPADTSFLRHHPLYVATAEGQLWRSIDSTYLDLVHANITGGADITALHIDPRNEHIWVGTVIGNLLLSTDAGKSWSAINQGLPNVEEKLQIMNRLQPQFTSTQYGDPGYVQLSRGGAKALFTGAEDEAEMGVFNFLKQPQRESSLQSSLEEYLRFGLTAGIFYMT